MKKSIYITGIAGSGKSTMSKELTALGYRAHDIEDDKCGLFMMVRKDTGERFMDYDNSDLQKVKNARWVCDLVKLKELIKKQSDELAFYCGVASDNTTLMHFFDLSILLRASPEVLNNRLLLREGTDDFANTLPGRKRVLGHKNEREEKMIKAGMIPVDADANPKEVALKIIDLVENKFPPDKGEYKEV